MRYYISPVCNAFLDVRIPFLIRGPGIMENKTVKQINVNVDIAPTMIEISGQTINPDDFDGISLLSFIMNKEQDDDIKRGNFLPFFLIIFLIDTASKKFIKISSTNN